MKKFAFLFFLSLACIAIGYVVLDHYIPQTLEGETYIAFAAPLSGKNKEVGQSMLKAAQLRLKEVNRLGGIHSKRLILDIYDDQSSVKGALEVAKQIQQDNRAVAVIGHMYSSQSVAAGKQYKAYKIPVITPAGTDVSITRDNEWSFRTVFDNRLQGRFMANYARKVLKFKTVSIIFEDGSYGPYLAKVIKRNAKMLGMRVPFMRSFSADAYDLDGELQQLVKAFKSGRHSGALFLISHTEEAILLVEALKDMGVSNTLIGSHAFASADFQAGFKGLDKELETPGFYTENLYVTTPMLFDNAGEKAQEFRMNFLQQYGKEPNWRDAFTYDSVDLILHALTKTKEGNLQRQRADIRNRLAHMTKPHLGIEGVTGFNYFDRQGNLHKPIVIGRYTHNQLISALTQLETISRPSEVLDLKQAKRDGRIVQVNNNYLFKTDMVYTGIQIHAVTQLDFLNQQCQITFDLWFRYQGEFDIQDITFLNQVEAIPLADPVEKQTQGGQRYVRYRMTGKFKMDYLPRIHFGEQRISINLSHKNITAQNLTFVKDVIGMPSDSHILERKEQIVKPATGYKIVGVQFYNDVLHQDIQGDLRYLALSQDALHYSRFNAVISLNKRGFSVLSLLPVHLAETLLLITFSLLVLRLFLGRIIQKLMRWKRMFWIFRLFVLLVFLLSLEITVLENMIYRVDFDQLEWIQSGFNIFWWLIPAWLIISALRHFVWGEIERKSQRSIPPIVPRFVGFLVFLLAILGILAFVFDQKVTSLLATSGVLAMIIGLAIQMNISNIFSGLAINIERPFRVGDWISINNGLEGKVTRITWRTTRITTRDKCSLSVPNSVASEAMVRNFNYPDDLYKSQLSVRIDGDKHPARVEQVLLNAVRCVSDVLDNPAPSCKMSGLVGLSADYNLEYTANDFAKKSSIQREVWDKVWHHLYQANLLPTMGFSGAAPLQEGQPRVSNEVSVMMEMHRQPVEIRSDSYRLLKGVDLFYRGFGQDHLQHLADSLSYRWYDEDDTMVTQGEEGDSLFIIAEGLVGVWIQTDYGEKMVSRLGTADVIGEMALLTGEVRTATIRAIARTSVCEISREQILPLLQKEPELGYKLSRILARRQLAMDKLRAANQQEDMDQLSDNFMEKIQQWFGLV